mgnify:CR=1 FL=1
MYFLHLSAMSCSASGATTKAPGGRGGVSVLYMFDNTPNDYFGIYHASPVNGPTYVSPGYNGRGSAIKLDRSSSQYLIVPSFMSFYQMSLTFEVWIYPFTVATADPIADFVIFSQINAVIILNQALQFMIRNGRSYGSFYANDVVATSMIGTNQWHHIAFTYDYTTRTQILYQNGIAGKQLINF